MGKVKERNFVNPFKLFFGSPNTEVQLSQSKTIDASDISEDEKEILKKALKEVEKFEKQMNNTVEQVKHMNVSRAISKAIINKEKVDAKNKQQNDRERE